MNYSTIIRHPLAFLEFKHVEKFTTWHTIPSDFAGVDAATDCNEAEKLPVTLQVSDLVVFHRSGPGCLLDSGSLMVLANEAQEASPPANVPTWKTHRVYRAGVEHEVTDSVDSNGSFRMFMNML